MKPICIHQFTQWAGGRLTTEPMLESLNASLGAADYERGCLYIRIPGEDPWALALGENVSEPLRQVAERNGGGNRAVVEAYDAARGHGTPPWNEPAQEWVAECPACLRERSDPR